MNITDIKGTANLSNGVAMPYFGLGVFKSQDGKEVIDAINFALDAGCRHIDTAAIYGNEKGVGKAIAESGIDRNDVFITSKVWNSDQGYYSTIEALHTSLEKLKMDYIDLYLVHWPVKDKTADTWRAMEYLYNKGLVKAIGVSNFLQHHLQDLLISASIKPMVNQVEFHPYLVQQELIDFCNKYDIQFESWSPIMRGKVFEIELLNQIAKKYGKNEAQIVLRWNLQKGIIVIPKSVKKERIESNAQLFDFEIDDEDIKAIDHLDRNLRTGPHPDKLNF